jgi:hypothetical protein
LKFWRIYRVVFLLHLTVYSFIFHYSKLMLLCSTVASQPAALAPQISSNCLCTFFALLKHKVNVMFTSTLTNLQLNTSNQICFLHDPKIQRRTTHLSESTEQCFCWKGNRFSDNLQISRICRKAKIHCYIEKTCYMSPS